MIILAKHLLILCPILSIEAANQACVQVTGLEASANTFSADNIMLMGGIEYAVAGVYVTMTEYEDLEPLKQALGGHYWTTKEQTVEQGWVDVQSVDLIMSENNITRPEIEDEI